jgi:ketosteroid isomerase-like protein
MTPPNLALVQGFYEAVRRGDLESATSVLDEDLVWIESPFPGHEGGCFEGKAAVLSDVLQPFLATWNELSVTPERFIVAWDDVVVLGRYRGRHYLTGRSMEARFTHTWTLRGGRAIRFEMLADTIQFFRTVEGWPLGERPVGSAPASALGNC